jgi:CSLREA domain-containing protein
MGGFLSPTCILGSVRGFTIRVAVSAGVACLVLAGGASAATLDVTKTGDPVPGACTTNDCSLREAVLRANGTAAADRISRARPTA